MIDFVIYYKKWWAATLPTLRWYADLQSTFNLFCTRIEITINDFSNQTQIDLNAKDAKDAKDAISINLAALRRCLRYFEIVLARMACPVSLSACNSKSRPWA